MKPILAAVCLAIVMLAFAPARGRAQDVVTYAYTSFDANKSCKHRKGREAEDYGTWSCPGYQGIAVRLSAGDQRMQVSFGPRAAKEPAAQQTLPGFNDIYKGTIEWRSARSLNGRSQPFATILRWNYMLNIDDSKAGGRMLVVTRLGSGGVCHVGYVDARQPGANEKARAIADGKARDFKCGTDKIIGAEN